MWMDDPILDDLLEELDNRCTAKKMNMVLGLLFAIAYTDI